MRDLLRTKGFKITQQRELIFGSFFELGEHVSVDELYAKVRQKDSSIGYATVWRNLKLACQVGLAEEVNIGDGVTRYDRVTKTPHGHLYCLQCKQFIEFEAEQVVKTLVQVAKRNEFSPDGFTIEVHGYCADCQRKREQASQEKSKSDGQKNVAVSDSRDKLDNQGALKMTPLSKLTPGQKGKVVGFAADNKITRRLIEMGLSPGRSVLYLRDAPLRDPMEIQVGDSCLSLRHTEASLVTIEVQE